MIEIFGLMIAGEIQFLIEERTQVCVGNASKNLGISWVQDKYESANFHGRNSIPAASIA